MTPAELAAYESGLMHGIDLGRRQVEEEDAARWAELRRMTRQIGTSYSELCERRARTAQERGHHDTAAVERARAALQDAIARRNGLSPLHTAPAASTRTAAA
ncbi:hypothetical protein [Antribacter gilvus]|uniref:hypothetical protein n=1 Tax=Antribacter gilvus TaxID=2304675 RepID=UPI000F7A3218|nr:hypothetical protein [Antribacter gilvus]